VRGDDGRLFDGSHCVNMFEALSSSS
jgi:hypothetical protein